MKTKKYRYNHKYRDAIERMLHFINIKQMKYTYKHNGNKTSSGDGSLSLRRDVVATCLGTNLQ